MPDRPETFATSPLEQLDQSSAFSRELKALSERPAVAPSQAPPEQPGSSGNQARTAERPDQPNRQQDRSGHHNPSEQHGQPGSDSTTQHEKSQLGLFGDVALDVSLAAGAVIAAEAIGAFVFKNPKLAAAAVESATASGRIALASDRIAMQLGKTAIWAGTMGTGVAARHYSYELLTGESESWNASSRHFGLGVFAVTVSRKLSDKFL